MRTALLMTGLALAIVVGHLPGIVAEASSAPLCEVRSDAHIAEHGGFYADSAYHIAHGELPTCAKESNARQGANHDDDKSRFCRKKWYC
ncbi:hypothetical protein SEA_YECEY3_88 [Mycobacterium phage Yecey3]|uniref:Uncharacterized protein n=1 Tax=Mycobacterium phage Yecey3 TaxID=2656617 RepID=A0A649V9L4_9CAUD|nr:site-specific recombination directionality factor RDF [Mycobacterium phage Yecey3]QGJ88839.1 hypothetical protein SEA_YECEY3_88 [Mycobacterium phage Yecey3]